MAATCFQSQLSCFSSQQRSVFCPIVRSSKYWVCMSLDDRSTNTARSEIKTTLSYTADESKPYVEGTTKLNPSIEEHSSGEMGNIEAVPEGGATQQKKAARIHDFCFGIPYVLSAVLVRQNFEAYLLTRKLFPTGFYAAISAAMLCFYSYVVVSGGNPPPKKLKKSAAVPS